MEQKHDNGQPKVFENLAYGVREAESSNKYPSNDRDEEKGFWWSICCGFFGF